MVRNILLKFDEAFYYKMLEHKLELAKKSRKLVTWESYIKLLFGFKDDN